MSLRLFAWPRKKVASTHSTLSRFKTTSADFNKASSGPKIKKCQFWIPKSELEQVLQSLTAHYKIVSNKGEILQEEEIVHFDTPTLKCFQDAESNKRPHHGIRICKTAKKKRTTLELTSRSIKKTTKRRFPCPVDLDHLRSIEHSILDDYLDFPSTSLQPKATISSKHFEFLSNDKREHVRVQTDLCFKSDQQSQTKSGHALVTLRCPNHVKSPWVESLRSKGYDFARTSLYREAIRMLYPEHS